MFKEKQRRFGNLNELVLFQSHLKTVTVQDKLGRKTFVIIRIKPLSPLPKQLKMPLKMKQRPYSVTSEENNNTLAYSNKRRFRYNEL